MMDAKQAAANAIQAVLEGKPGESLLVVTDDVRSEVGETFAQGGLELGLWTRLLVLETEEDVYRKSVPPHLVEIANSPNPPDIYINTLRGPAQETPFRIQIIKLETRKRRSRLGHCPGITMDMLTEGALALTTEEHAKMQSEAESLLAKIQDSVSVHVTSPSGSDFTLNVRGRKWFTDTKLNWRDMKWMNLPTGEVLVGPVETQGEGKLVSDLAIGGIGPIDSNFTIEFENGKVKDTDCGDDEALRIVRETQDTDEMAKHVGEFAFGLNPKARLVEEFLESEKLGNAIHVAFGNNMDYPGETANNSGTHQDFLVDEPTVVVKLNDGTELTVMKDGKLQV
ncbi:MAG: aminopeptidase [Candidatus Thorarchaeota archaeon]|nr:aminopeptidase [Candidatus Thorarchaeota archaeon]